MDGELIETPCQNFEEVPQTLASTEVTTNKPPLKMASLKDARAMIEEGAQRAVRHAQIGRPPLHISNRGVNTIEDREEDSDIDNWIYPTTNGGLSNWTARDFIPIYFIPQ